MKKSTNILIMLLMCGISGAWKINFKLTNKFGGDGSDKYPASEKDYAYMFCENGVDADNSQKGKADWRRSTSHDYCWNEHRGSDDTWKSGWERSRLMRGCKSQLNFAGNKVYRCFDVLKDPEFLQIEQSMADQKKQDYEDWLALYNAKVDELYKGANQTFGDIDAELKAAEEKEAKAKAAKEKMVQDAALAKRTVDELSARHAQMDKLLGSLVEQFDKGWNALVARTDKLALDIDAANIQTTAFRSRVNGSDKTYSSLSAIQTEATGALNQTSSGLCSGQNTGGDIETLRGQVAYMNKLIDGVLVDAEQTSIPAAFTETRGAMLEKLRTLYELTEKRDFIFDSSYDVLSENPSVCNEIKTFLIDLGEAVAYAKRAEEIKKTIGVIADMEAALKQIEDEKQAEAQYLAALSETRSLEGQWANFLQRGRVAKAKSIIDSIDQSIVRIMSAPALLASKADLTKLKTEIETWKTKMLDEAGYRISLNGANGMLFTRGREIKTAIMKLEIKAKKNVSLSSVWNLQKQEILSVLNTKPGQEIQTPNFSDWPSLLAYEEMLERIGSSLDQLLLQNP